MSPRPAPRTPDAQSELAAPAPGELLAQREGALHRAVTRGSVLRHQPDRARELDLVEDDEVRDDPALADDEVIDPVELDRLARCRDAVPGSAAVRPGHVPAHEDVVA